MKYIHVSQGKKTSKALASYFKNMLLGLSPFIKNYQLGFNLIPYVKFGL